ncbi:ABC transporter permease [Streptomyces sp. NPDC059009]|uniref:ABC transporter permease n=1 Tax=Streptomyces sp. NPDC059009 TaxID=3346694 RepID=UPI0036803C7D
MSVPKLHGPAWAAVRIHRAALWTGLALVVVSAGFLGVLRGWLVSANAGNNCDTDIGASGCHDYQSAGDWLSGTTYVDSKALLIVPFLVGAFVAGPAIARELESRTHLLAWSQSVPPARWLAAKLALAALTATALSLALMGALQLGRTDADGFSTWGLDWSERGAYEATGPALVAYCLLAVAVGALTGLLVRRTVAAMAVSGLVTGAVLLALGSVRWDLLPTRTTTGKTYGNDLDDLFVNVGPAQDVYVTDSGALNSLGQRFHPGECGYRCPADDKVTGWYSDYHPRSHFWYIQFIETGIVLALAALAVYAAFRVLRRRTA